MSDSVHERPLESLQNHPFVRTTFYLAQKPESVVDPFVNGEKKAFIHPLKYAVITAVTATILLFGLVSFKSVYYELSYMPSQIVGAETTAERIGIYEAEIKGVSFLMNTLFLPVSQLLLLTPFLALAGTFFFRESRPGFYRHLILSTYAISFSIFSVLILMVLWWIAGSETYQPWVHALAPPVLMGCFTVWVYFHYFKPNTFLSWIRLISTYAAGFAGYLILSGIVKSVIAFFLYVTKVISGS